MTASLDMDTLTEFFDRYGAALTVADLPAIAACYAMPGQVVSGTYSFSFTSPAAVALSFVGAAPDYRDRQLIAANAQILDVRQVSALLTLVEVEWEYLDSLGQAVPGERFHYLLRSTLDGPLICTVIRS